MKIKSYAALEAKVPLTEFEYSAIPLGTHDLRIKVTHCGICHSDIHLIDNDWNSSQYPLVPGHEIIGIVSDFGNKVTDFKIGDRVGIGWQCDACFRCEWCLQSKENLCAHGQATAVGHYGGFGEYVQTNQRFAFKIPENLSSETAAPLLCGGITVYSPLHNCHITPNMKVAVVGIGGLGHLALQFYHAFGCEVTALSSNSSKEKDAYQFGAHHFEVTQEEMFFNQHASQYDFIISTVPHILPWEKYLSLLRPMGQLCIVGVAEEIKFNPMSIIVGNKRVCGSGIGDTKTIKEMLAFASLHQIKAKTEIFSIHEINRALNLVRENKVYYRGVLKY